MSSELIPSKIENYCLKHSVPESQLFKELAAETQEKMESFSMQVGHLEGTFLRFLVRIARARRILEIGTFTGYSSLCMAKGLPENGELITCDIDPVATSIAKKYWAKSPHGRKISLILGPALESLKSITGLFDLVFIDADKENYSNYWEAVVPKVTSGGLIVADNVLWSGRVFQPTDVTDKAIVEFNHRVAADTRVEPLMVTIRDGITLAHKL